MWRLWVTPEKFGHALLQMIHVQLWVKFVNRATPQPIVLSVREKCVCVCVCVCACVRERERERERESERVRELVSEWYRGRETERGHINRHTPF